MYFVPSFFLYTSIFIVPSNAQYLSGGTVSLIIYVSTVPTFVIVPSVVTVSVWFKAIDPTDTSAPIYDSKTISAASVGGTYITVEYPQFTDNRTLKENLVYTVYVSEKQLDISNVVAGTKYRGEFEEKLKKILKKVKEDPNAIIFIDEIHNIIGAGGAEGAIDASNILKPYLSRG